MQEKLEANTETTHVLASTIEQAITDPSQKQNIAKEVETEIPVTLPQQDPPQTVTTELPVTTLAKVQNIATAKETQVSATLNQQDQPQTPTVKALTMPQQQVKIAVQQTTETVKRQLKYAERT